MGKSNANRQSAAVTSTGVGESIPNALYASDPAAFEMQNPLNDPRHPANCTIGGEAIPDHLWSRIVYAQTDQGMAEREEENRDNPKPTPGLEFVRDEVHQGISQRGEDLDRGKTSRSIGVVTGAAIEQGILDDDAFDPRRELVLKHVPPGMRPKFLAADRVGADGTGAGGYQICMDGNGKPVRHGSSFLGYIPEDRAVSIQSRFEAKSQTAQAEIYQNDLLQQERALRGGSPLASFERPDPGSADLGLQDGSLGGDD